VGDLGDDFWGGVNIAHTPLFAHATSFSFAWYTFFIADAIFNRLFVISCLVGGEGVVAIALACEGVCGLESVDSSLCGRVND
jgi:hypothetical protein